MYHSCRDLWPLGKSSVADFCSLTKEGGRASVRKSGLKGLMTFYCKRFAKDKNFLFLMSDQRRRHESALHTAKLRGGKLMKGFEEMINTERKKCSVCKGTGKCSEDPCTEFSI